MVTRTFHQLQLTKVRWRDLLHFTLIFFHFNLLNSLNYCKNWLKYVKVKLITSYQSCWGGAFLWFGPTNIHKSTNIYKWGKQKERLELILLIVSNNWKPQNLFSFSYFQFPSVFTFVKITHIYEAMDAIASSW